MSGPATRKDKLTVLVKRAHWLEQRITSATDHGRNGLSFDRAELAALRWAIGELQPIVDANPAAE